MIIDMMYQRLYHLIIIMKEQFTSEKTSCLLSQHEHVLVTCKNMSGLNQHFEIPGVSSPF